jgi:hypothetical protein
MSNVPQLGDYLPNGAVVVHATERDGEGVVLAGARFPHPWVTWSYRAGDPVTTVSGHYFDNLLEATKDYRARGGDDATSNHA